MHSRVVAGELTPVPVGEMVNPTAFTPFNWPQRLAVSRAPLVVDLVTVTPLVIGKV